MSLLPRWLRDAAQTFDPENKNWIQEGFLPLIERRNEIRKQEGLPLLSQSALGNLFAYLKAYLMRKHGSKLLSAEFDQWLESMGSSSLSEHDMCLLEAIQEQRHSIQDLLKLQREMASRLRKAPKKSSVVDRQFVALELLKPGIKAVMTHRGFKVGKRKKAPEMDQPTKKTKSEQSEPSLACECSKNK